MVALTTESEWRQINEWQLEWYQLSAKIAAHDNYFASVYENVYKYIQQIALYIAYYSLIYR